MEQNLIEFDELMIDYLTGSLSEENTGKFYTLLQSDMIYQRRYDELAKLHAQSFISLEIIFVLLFLVFRY